jgi:hypothetical protein
MTKRAKFSCIIAVLASITAWLAPAVVEAATTSRPISDFVDVQGTFCPAPCVIFVPPVPNFIGWSDPSNGLNASVDYAGLANKTFDNAFGTTFAGTVTERPLSDGTAEVSVLLRTNNALTWVINGNDFSTDPVVFGQRWTKDPPANPALGSSELQVVFINTAPGAPLLDLEELLGPRFSTVRFIAFRSNSSGLLPNGAAGRAQVTQSGVLMTIGLGSGTNPGPGRVHDFFPAEHVNIQAVGL